MFKWLFGSDRSYEDRQDDIEQRFQEKLERLKQRKQMMSNEPYRVGITQDGMTTLTVIAEPGNSMTLTMSPEACETLIRLIRATYTKEKAAENV